MSGPVLVLSKPEPTEPVLETYLFFMPEDPEEFLCAVACIQGYITEVAKRNIKPSLTLACPDWNLSFLTDTIPNAMAIAEPFDAGHSRDYDMVFAFNVEEAKAISEATCKHLAQSFSIQLGGSPQLFPDLTSIVKREVVADLLIMPFEGYTKFAELVENNHPEKKIIVVDANRRYLPEEIWMLVCSSRTVVGVRSMATLMAASLLRSVVEIYPPSTGSRYWLTKQGIPFYQMVFAEEKDVPVTMLYRALEVLWRRLGPRSS